MWEAFKSDIADVGEIEVSWSYKRKTNPPPPSAPEPRTNPGPKDDSAPVETAEDVEK